MKLISFNIKGERTYKDYDDIIEILIDTNNNQLFISRISTANPNKILREIYDITDNFHNFKIK